MNRSHRAALPALAVLWLAAPSCLFADEPMVLCRDGTSSKNIGKGTCSHHDGIKRAAIKVFPTAPAKPMKTPADPVAASSPVASPPGSVAAPDAAPVNAATQVAPSMAKPVATSPPAVEPGAVACRDGTTSKDMGKGACSHHGGVWVRTVSGKPEGDAAKPVTAKCKDGTTSHSTVRVGACSDHGGIAQWIGSK